MHLETGKKHKGKKAQFKGLKNIILTDLNPFCVCLFCVYVVCICVQQSLLSLEVTSAIDVS